MDDVRTILVFLGMFTALVFVHELGHFLTARLTGMRVLEFGFGFPPKLFSIRTPARYRVTSGDLALSAGDTSLRLRSGDELVVREGRGVYALSAGERTLRLSDGDPFSVSGAATFRPSWAKDSEHEFRVAEGDFATGLATGATFPFPPGVEYSVNWIPFGGFVRILGEDGTSRLPDGSLSPDSFAARPIPARMLVLVAGVVMNVLLAIVVYATIFATGEPTFNGKVRWAHVDPGSPAQAAGMRDGDVIVKIDGRSFAEPLQMRDYIIRSAGREIVLTIEREGQTFETRAVPREDPPANQGPLGLRDAEPVRELVVYPVPEALARSVERTWVILGETVRAFSRFVTGPFTGGGSVDEVAGPVGIFNITGQVAERGLAYVLELTALLSVNLAVLNIVPFPGLDGGRLLFVVVEALRGGRRIDPRTEAAVHAVGFVFLLLLVGLVTIYDIRRLPGG